MFDVHTVKELEKLFENSAKINKDLDDLMTKYLDPAKGKIPVDPDSAYYEMKTFIMMGLFFFLERYVRFILGTVWNE